jgi:hypothetical protein
MNLRKDRIIGKETEELGENTRHKIYREEAHRYRLLKSVGF